MGYDDVIQHVGNLGRYQCSIISILLLPAIACAFHKMGGVFFGAKADFRCLLPHESLETAIFQSPTNITNLTYQWNEETKKWPQCEIHIPDFVDLHHDKGENLTSSISSVKCDLFVYDKTHGTQSVTTEWNLVCDDAWLKSLSESLFMLANLPGVIILGGLSDRYGRKPTLLWGSIMQIIVAVLVSISPNFKVYAVLRVLVGATTSGLLIVGYVAAVEMVPPRHRTTLGVVENLVFSGGFILSTGLAYYIRTWRYLQIAFTIPTIVLLAFWWSIPESARWLMTKGRVQEAKDILQKISLSNGIQLSSDKFDSLLSDDNKGQSVVKKTSAIDLLRYPNLRKNSLSLFFIWFTTSGTYYGLSWTSSNLGGNVHLNFAIAAAVEIPACLILLFTLDRWGRKSNLSGGLLFAGISLLLIFFVPGGMTWLTILLTMLGKFAITYCWGTMYVFTAELYPTAVRNIGVAACTAFANMGSTLAPQISYLFEISTYLPLVMLGSCALIAGLISLRLPETANAQLPETIEDGEKLEKNTGNTRQLKDVDCA